MSYPATDPRSRGLASLSFRKGVLFLPGGVETGAPAQRPDIRPGGERPIRHQLFRPVASDRLDRPGSPPVAVSLLPDFQKKDLELQDAE